MVLCWSESVWLHMVVENFSERQGIVNHASVRTLGSHVTEAFDVQLHRNHPLYPNLSSTATMVLLPSLRTIGSKHDHLLNYYRARWQSMKLPPLFAEVYDFPKAEDQGSDGAVDCGSFVDDENECSSASGSNGHKVPYGGTTARGYYDESPASDGTARENVPFRTVRGSEIPPVKVEGFHPGDYGARSGSVEGFGTNAESDDSRKGAA